MASVIETFHRYVTIWTCMNAAATITAALYTAHQMGRTRGIQSRILLALLVEIDNGQHLDTPSREQVSADIAAFAHVSLLWSLSLASLIDLLGTATGLRDTRSCPTCSSRNIASCRRCQSRGSFHPC